MFIDINENSNTRRRDVKSSFKKEGTQKPILENEFETPLSELKTNEVVANRFNLHLFNLFSLIYSHPLDASTSADTATNALHHIS